MIGFLKGTVIFQEKDYIFLDVHGVGYRIFVNDSMLYPMGGMVHLWIETYVRDDKIHLYGFQKQEEQYWFQLLLNVQGVGARMAMSILQSISVNDLYNAIVSEDYTKIRTVNGIGQKLAIRIVQELKSNVCKNSKILPKDSPSFQIIQDSVSALVRLGYDLKKATEVVQRVQTNSLSETLRRALKEIT